MKILSFVTQKGGSGKTTLAFSCAVAAEQAGLKVLIIDMDPQKTAERWYQDREAATPQLVSITSPQLDQAITAAQARGFDLVLLDTPGRDEPSVAAAIRVSDLCIIPCRPTPADMKATPQTVNTIKRLDKPAAFVLTQTPARSFRIREAGKGLSVLSMVSPDSYRNADCLSRRSERRYGGHRVRTRRQSRPRSQTAMELDYQKVGEGRICPRRERRLMP